MKELSLEEAALAWAQGKRVECLTVNQTEYLPVSRVGTSDGIISPTCFGERGDDRVRYKFRLASEPPAKKFRHWTRDEVPIGAIIKAKGKLWKSLIVGVMGDGLIQIHDGGFSPEFALENHVHSLDGGKTWLPCGVEVDA